MHYGTGRHSDISCAPFPVCYIEYIVIWIFLSFAKLMFSGGQCIRQHPLLAHHKLDFCGTTFVKTFVEFCPIQNVLKTRNPLPTSARTLSINDCEQ